MKLKIHFIFPFSFPVSHYTCTAYLKEFGKTTAKFIQCSIEKARPFRFCEMCVVQYKRAMIKMKLKIHFIFPFSFPVSH
jgi:hypothetical protein